MAYLNSEKHENVPLQKSCRNGNPVASIKVDCQLLLLTTGELERTVFAARWLHGDKKNAVKKFASVFGKRVAQFAEPSSCQHCECSSHDSGMGFMDCKPCDFPAPATINLGLADYIDEDLFPIQDGDMYDEEDEELDKEINN